MDKRQIGNSGEAIAEKAYWENGYTTLEKNYKTRFGEIDLILEKGELLIFCEVKTRKENSLYRGALAVTKAKQKRIILATQHYLCSMQLSQPFVRFDVAEVYYSKGDELPKINIIESAFEV